MIQKFNVSRDDSIYEAWPDVVLTDGGKLICVLRNASIIKTAIMREL
jgi:sialidase-1